LYVLAHEVDLGRIAAGDGFGEVDQPLAGLLDAVVAVLADVLFGSGDQRVLRVCAEVGVEGERPVAVVDEQIPHAVHFVGVDAVV
jgi:hypothetical protein